MFQSILDKIQIDMPQNPVLSGWSAFSQFDEDGIIKECLKRISNNTQMSKCCLEIGCGNGLENNTHLLALEYYKTYWVDGSSDHIANIEETLGGTNFPNLKVKQHFLDLENIDALLEDVHLFARGQNLDFASMDVDGNDLAFTYRLVKKLSPKLLCVEYNAKFPPPISICTAYDPSHEWDGDDYFGASLQAFVDILPGYTLVSCNLIGTNAFFVRNDLTFGFMAYDIARLYMPPRYSGIDPSNQHRRSLNWLKQLCETRTTGCDTPPRIVPTLAKGPQGAPFMMFVHGGYDEYISRGLIQYSTWEPFESRVFTALCEPSSFVLDIGGNIGWYSMIAANTMDKSGRIFVFEPAYENFQVLVENLKLISNGPETRAFNVAVSHQDGERELFYADTNLGDHRAFDGGEQRHSSRVLTRSLDSILKEFEVKPDLVKCDTQGSEYQILEGATELFADGWRPIILIEYWPYGLAEVGDDAEALFQKLNDLGYDAYIVSEEKQTLIAVSIENIRHGLASEVTVESRDFWNLLFMPHARHVDLESRDLPIVAYPEP